MMYPGEAFSNVTAFWFKTPGKIGKKHKNGNVKTGREIDTQAG